MDFKVWLENASALLTPKKPVQHWLNERLTALLLIPLSFWLITFLFKLIHASYTESLSWLTSPINCLAIVLWISTVFYHAALGLQVVLEDYVSNLEQRHLAIKVSNLFFLGLGVVALLLIINIIL